MSRSTSDIRIRKMVTSDSAKVVSLNQSVVSVTSPMDTEKFNSLFDFSQFKTVAILNGECVAFIFAIGQGSEYANANYQWFSSRLDNFMYVDRVVVSSSCRGLGVGSLLYADLFDSGGRTGKSKICAEIDIEPPNQSSLRFHEKFGFAEIGTRTLDSGKRVSMQVKD